MSEGPRATDVLANERTFLAYVRTALSFVAFGFVIARFALFTREISSVLHLEQAPRRISADLGTSVALVGAAVALYGGWRYVASARALDAGRVAPMPPFAAVAGAAVVAALGVVVGLGLVAYR